MEIDMRIKPSDLVPEPLQFDQSIPVGAIDYAPDVRQTGPLAARGTADLIEEHGEGQIIEDIRVRAHCRGTFELLCARCLDPIGHRADLRFDLIFRPSGTDAETGERSISEAETEIGYYESSGLQLEDVVREQVLLSLPDRSLCREDCKGLCPRCGGNRNEMDCTCAEAEIDPRWSALQALRSEAEQRK